MVLWGSVLFICFFMFTPSLHVQRFLLLHGSSNWFLTGGHSDRFMYIIFHVCYSNCRMDFLGVELLGQKLSAFKTNPFKKGDRTALE